jgi:Domain of unknown function (DUF927)
VFVVGGPNGTEVESVVSTWPIFLHDVASAEKAGDYAFVFQHWKPEMGWHQLTARASDIVGPQGNQVLANLGANILEYTFFLKYVRAAWDEFNANRKNSVRFDQYGWKDKSFLYGPKLYSAASEQAVSGSKEIELRNKWVGPGCTTKGDPAYGLARWKQAASALFCKGCEAQSAAVLAGFAAPLMRFQSSDEGGSVLALVTRESGTGKTTALAGACSIWGHKNGLSLTNDDNRVAKFLTLAALGNLPVVFDELSTRDPLVVREFVVTFTNGRDKQRGARDGDRVVHSGTWQTICITASNSSLVEALSETSKADAPAFRVLELPLEVPENLRTTLGDRLKEELIANAGYAGEAFVRYLVQPEIIDWTSKALREYTAEVWRRTNLRPEHRFWVRTIAAIHVAGLLVQQLALLDFDPTRITEWLIDRVTIKPDVRTKEDKQRESWYVEALTHFLAQLQPSTLILPQEPKSGGTVVHPTVTPRDQIKAVYFMKENKLTLSVHAMREFAVKHELPLREWARMLEKDSIITEPRRRNLCWGTMLPGAQTLTTDVIMIHPALRDMAPIGMPIAADMTNVTPLPRRP